MNPRRTIIIITAAGVAVIMLLAAAVYSGRLELPLSEVLGLNARIVTPQADSGLPDSQNPSPATRQNRQEVKKADYSQVISPTPVPYAYRITFTDVPEEANQNDPVTFTWSVDGPARTIRTSTVYYGSVSTPGKLIRSVEPEKTAYDGKLSDFLDGSYDLPLRFIAGTRFAQPGTYYARGYALIGGDHYWSDELTIRVRKMPVHEINIIGPPATAARNSNIAFTWEITGPAAQTGFSTIVSGRQSLPGELDPTVDIPRTPYAVLVNDFTNGTYDIPLRFIGNAIITEPGVYYYRALGFIGGKNIWSAEHSLTVE
ncbi:hypothetical protein A2Z33_07365 [Candidatus Gottesmanbacteria bacterium RBG_16_52_11]|uniref:Uncharacterized protein n=1 Tax=Candidatus Gottesmanbacteria bacterium RBG_16_52_11 TaxID=1798374 RepID=A0A1F5YXZ7_9BACT|nr:MAG: hypothetical protein A2Z33_07365 [Candidatus Gottesmanbacteria bacterium RBG_16_52_11]